MVTREQDSDDSDDDDDDDAVDDLLDSDEDEIDEDGQVYLESLQVGSPLADLQGYLAGLQEKLFLHKKFFFLKYNEILDRFTGKIYNNYGLWWAYQLVINTSISFQHKVYWSKC